MPRNEFYSQEKNTDCFVIAVANCLVYLKKEVPDLEVARDVAACRHGGAIYRQETVDYMKAPLRETEDAEEVLEKGGTISILHPIFNGHHIFVHPSKKYHVIMVNSWLGPNVIEVANSEIRPFIRNNFGKHWVIECGTR